MSSSAISSELAGTSLKYLAVAADNLFSERLGSGTIISVCRQLKHGGCSSQGVDCISANGVGDLVRINGTCEIHADTYPSYNPIRDAFDWPQIYSAA